MAGDEFLLRGPPTVIGRAGRILRHEFTKLGFVRVVAMGAEQVEFFAVPLAHTPAVDAAFPVPVNQPVALSAKPMGLFKRNRIAID